MNEVVLEGPHPEKRRCLQHCHKVVTKAAKEMRSTSNGSCADLTSVRCFCCGFVRVATRPGSRAAKLGVQKGDEVLQVGEDGEVS